MNPAPVRIGLLLLAAGAIVAPARSADPPGAGRKIDFARDVRPILADNCFACHGPDEKTRKADLRLDTRDGLLGGHTVGPGPAAKSELVARVTAKDPDEVMPPPKSGKKLTPEQIATLKAWIDQGAPWSAHWAFAAPARPPVPGGSEKPSSWVRNPIDGFVLAQLEKAGLKPSPEADKTTLIRRVTLDLTGLPPTPEEVASYLKDESPDAYGKVVDRLLASPRYGERMAWRWLEAARYADTNGYQTDAGRDMWRWRDWVIEAYNRNLPFDRFTVEQLAGDLLPNPTLDQRIATGFNRNHRGNAEGGIVPEEYAVEYVADRVETTATVWLGLTLGCARCHDHKFDPLTQKEFYQLFAFFNNVPEKGRAVKFGNSPPVIKAPTREQANRLAELDAKLQDATRRVAEIRDETATALDKWEKTANPADVPDWSPTRGLVAHWKLDDAGGLVVKDGATSFAPGRLGKALDLDGRRYAEDAKAGDFGFDDKFSLAAWVYPTKLDGAIVSRTPEEQRAAGYAVHLVNGRVQVHLTMRWLDDALRVEALTPIDAGRWRHVAVTYDASRSAAGVKVYVDGVEAKTRVLLDELNQTFRTTDPFRIGSGGGRDSRFVGRIDDVRVYDRAIEPVEARVLAVAETPGELLRKAAGKRTAGEIDKLRAYFLEQAAPPRVRESYAGLRAAGEARRKFWESIPTVMVMEEMPTPRESHILLRGVYDKKGEKVTPAVPAVLGRPEAGTSRGRERLNRLDLAKWIASPANPLTARVIVNRAWQLHFGVGLVKTTEDFGTQGAFPTHPELLDWLAAEFVSPAPAAGRDPGTPWDLKQLHKLIVTSATYRQSSRVTKDLRAKDPENRLLARFPRQRLSAEMVRDQALFASGLLAERLGGPSVKPYQPGGLWKELTGGEDYTPDTGEGLYRRSLYTYWKRTAPPPVMATFDAAGRETCWVRESRTNTPLQALALLNETGFVEASRAIAQRVLKEAPDPAERLTRAFRRVLARTPTEKELGILRRGLDHHLAEYRRDPAAARKLLTIGASKPDPVFDAAELAAYTTVCGLILNLDETVTKE
ncbi:MAG: Planctomycete cytochrome [Gemmataceae bacterium]|nr:Planctomycete cytochrome [Gemmataceae bacterium]